MKRNVSITLLAAALLGAGRLRAGEGPDAPSLDPAQAGKVRFNNAWVDKDLVKHVAFKTTLGWLRIAVQPDVAPHASRYFLELARAGIYDGTLINEVRRGKKIVVGHWNTRHVPLTPAQRKALRKVESDAGVRQVLYGGVMFADLAESKEGIQIYTGSQPYVETHASVFARVLPGTQTIRYVDEISLFENFQPMHPLVVLETLVLAPDDPLPTDLAYDQIVEINHRRTADPRYFQISERQRLRAPPAVTRPAGQDPVFALLLVLLVLGTGLHLFGAHLPRQALVALGLACLMAGAFGLFVLFAPEAQDLTGTSEPTAAAGVRPEVGALLFACATAFFWLVSRFERRSAE